MTYDDIMARAQQATSHADLLLIISGLTLTSVNLVSFASPGAKTARRQANAAAKAILSRVGTDANLLTDTDKEQLRQYSGLGGIGGSVHEYYTPQFIAEGMWDLFAANGFDGGNVGEPAAGAGVFNGTKPDGVIITASEMDGTSSQINQLLHPEDKVHHKTFEQLVQIVPDDTYDGMTGNVPFSGSRPTAYMDPEYQHIKQAERYFIARMLDKLQPGKLLICVVPTQIISRKSWSKWRAEISLKAEFLGAHRLPAGVFADNGTDVVTDVIVMRKHTSEIATVITDLTDADLTAAGVLWDPFISGRYFTLEGKRFVHGDAEQVQGQFGLVDTVKKDGRYTDTGLKAKLAKRFDSRIQYAALELAEPVTRHYTDGDQRKMNGRWYERVAGDWRLMAQDQTLTSLDVTRYGVDSVEALKGLLTDPTLLLTLTFDQIAAIVDDYEYLLSDHQWLIDAYFFAHSQAPAHHARVFRGTIIGRQVIALQQVTTKTRQVPAATAAALRALVSDEIAQFGVAANDKTLHVLTAGKLANEWNAFAAATNKVGDYSDLLSGTLNVSETVAFDSTDAAQVIAHLYSQYDLSPIPFDDFITLYTGDDPPTTVNELAHVDGVAITFDGHLMPFDRATSGDVVLTADRINTAMAQYDDPAMIANFSRQLTEIERKRTRNGVNDIEYTLKAKWIPRAYIREFMHDTGYDELVYANAIDTDDGVKLDSHYTGEDGVFVGYTQRANGKKRTSNEAIAFPRQLENYLNGLPVRGKDNAAAARYRERIKVIEEQFSDWLKSHDDVEGLTDRYNNTFNGYVPFAHSDAPLRLENVSDDVQLMDYQTSAVRRLSDEGKGILALGTGLGKTYTALGLLAYNQQMGRSKRTCVVVPKAVLENWYHEIKAFYGRDNLHSILIPGISVTKSKEGDVETELVLDEHGEPKLNGHTGQPQYRDKISVVSDSRQIKAALASIPQSNYSIIVLTKEQFAKIPIRPESIADHVEERVSQGALKGKYKALADTYRKKQANENFEAKYTQVGSTKYTDVPYFDDMNFTDIMADEGHVYRNSYAVGYNASRLAYLPTSPSSDVAVDMALKSNYVRRQNGGRGMVILTATPTVNSPTDIYNMLSLVLSPEEWALMGISDVDDFIEMFGEVESTLIAKLSGALEEKDALVGFKNLSGLRNLFHRWVNLKNAGDVAQTVKIPRLDERKVSVELTQEQRDIYDELRVRADKLNNKVQETELITLPDGSEVSVAKLDHADTIFGIIRKMDQVTTDIDLYYQQITFVLPMEHHAKVQALMTDLPASMVVGKSDDEDDVVTHNAQLITKEDTLKLITHEAYEHEVMSRLADFSIPEAAISHPMTPKYARLIELLKTGMKDGKQIIFTEEKSQHAKLRRLLAHHLGLSLNSVGIINADTVAGKGKNSVDEHGVGLEAIANHYNTGQLDILIANKKAEVGVNLHHGTTDLYHLTLPWTPASIDQRNGRGARVGGKADKLRVHYLLGAGSFDDYRLKTLMQKKQWMTELFTTTDERMSNADATASAEEMNMLLAADPAEREQRDKDNKRQQQEKVRQTKTRLAQVDLTNFIKASHDLNSPIESIHQAIRTHTDQIDATDNEIAQLLVTISRQEKELTEYFWAGGAANLKINKRRLTETRATLRAEKAELLALRRKESRLAKAKTQYKQLRPQIAAAISDGLIDGDHQLLDHADQVLLNNGRLIRIGQYYHRDKRTKHGRSELQTEQIIEVMALNFDLKEVTAVIHFTDEVYTSTEMVGESIILSVNDVGQLTSYTPSQITLKAKLLQPIAMANMTDTVSQADFVRLLKTSELRLAVDTVLTETKGTFGTVYPSAASKHADNIVYPDATDEHLKSRLAKWLLAERAMLDPYNGLQSTFKAIFGINVIAAIEAYGNQADAKIINDWLDTTYQAAVDDSQWYERLIATYRQGKSTWQLGATLQKVFANLPTKYANHAAFTAPIKQYVTHRQNRLIQQITAEEQHQAQMRLNLIAIEDAQPLSEISERLKWLTDNVGIIGADAAGIASFIDDTQLSGPYNALSMEKRLTTLYSDMKRLGFSERLSSDLRGSVETVFNNRRVHQLMLTGYEQLTTEPSLTDDTPAVEVIPVTHIDVSELSAADVLDQQTPDTIAGVIVRTNARAINVATRSYQLRGKTRRQVAIDFGVGDVFCLHDPQGLNGRLFEVKDELKALAGKGNFLYAADLNDDYAGSWWFVKTQTTDIAALENLLVN